ncbi:MAG: OmpA family protein [Pseudomonadota bacterium]
MTEKRGSSHTETHSTRRYWRQSDTPAGWWPWSLLPLLGLLLLWLLGSLMVAPAVEPQIERNVSATLSKYDVSGIDVDGQDVRVRLDLADEDAVRTASAFAQSTRCDTWAGNLICPTSVSVSSDRMPPRVVAEPVVEAVEQRPAEPELPAEVVESPVVDRCNEQFAETLSTATIRFRTASAQIADSNDELLDNLASIASGCPGTLTIEGHTDAVGSEENNQILSQARANAVRIALSSRGLQLDRIQAVGYGETRPIADNTTESGKAQNRRIVIRVTNP